MGPLLTLPPFFHPLLACSRRVECCRCRWERRRSYYSAKTYFPRRNYFHEVSYFVAGKREESLPTVFPAARAEERREGRRRRSRRRRRFVSVEIRYSVRVCLPAGSRREGCCTLRRSEQSEMLTTDRSMHSLWEQRRRMHGVLPSLWPRARSYKTDDSWERLNEKEIALSLVS